MALLFLLMGMIAAAGERAPVERQHAANCSEYARASDEARSIIVSQWQRGQFSEASLKTFASTSRRARKCYQSHAPLRAGSFLRRELYALHYAKQYQELLEASDDYLKQVPPATDPATRAYVFHRRGDVYTTLARPVESMHAYAQALRYADDLALGLKLTLLTDAADARMYFRDLEGAIELYEQALQHLSTDEGRALPAARHRGPVLVDLADALNSMARGEHRAAETGLIRRALSTAMEAEKLYRHLDHPELLGMALVEKSQALALDGRLQAAAAAAEEAERLSHAEKARALRIAGPEKLSYVLMQIGRLSDARQYLIQALGEATDIHDYDYRRQITYHLGLLYELQGDLKKAEFWYRSCIADWERYRAALGQSQWSALLLNASANPYHGLVRVLLHQRQDAEAFRVLNAAKARHLYDLRRFADAMRLLSGNERRSADSLRNHLNTLTERAWKADSGTPESEPASATAELERTQTEAALALLLKHPTSSPELMLPELQHHLRSEGRVLISYFISRGAERFGMRGTATAFVVTPDTLAAVPLKVRPHELRTLITQVSPLLSAGATRQTAALGMDATRFDLVTLHELYVGLMAPLEGLIPAGAPLTVIPDAELHFLPFGVLVRSRPTERFAYASADYLLRHHPVTMEASASLVTPRKSEKPTAAGDTFGYDVVALGISDFPADRLVAQFGGGIPVPAVSYAFRSGPYFDLPAVVSEISTFKSLFRRVLTLLGDKATEPSLYRHMAEGAVLHVATHTVVHPEDPFQSTIILAPDSSSGDDGLVRLYELRGRSLNTPLVVLSSCNTAGGRLLPGEGIQGLHYGFRAMGVQSLLATRWPVDDAAHAALMKQFYRHLRDGIPKDAALQRAQLSYLKSADRSRQSPFYWAAATLYGNPSSLKFHNKRPWSAYLVAGLIFLVTCSIAVRRRRTRRGVA